MGIGASFQPVRLRIPIAEGSRRKNFSGRAPLSTRQAVCAASGIWVHATRQPSLSLNTGWLFEAGAVSMSLPSDRPIKDRITADYATLMDNFANLVKAARVPSEQADAGRAQVTRLSSRQRGMTPPSACAAVLSAPRLPPAAHARATRPRQCPSTHTPVCCEFRAGVCARRDAGGIC
jgi:hypothetical protein